MKYIIFYVCFTFLIGSISPASRLKRVIGGDYALIRNFPYQASIRFQGIHICSGVIISNQHILTAAHCLTSIKDLASPYSDLSISTGTSCSTETGRTHNIASVIIHPGWLGTDNYKLSPANDIAVIKLEEEMRFDRWQQKIDMIDYDFDSPTVGIFTGWGCMENEKREPAIQLQKLYMWVFNSTECRQNHVRKIHDKELCAFHSSGHGSCYGDSGGPLVVDDEVVGVLSWIVGDEFALGKAEVFTNVYAQRDFIEWAMEDFQDMHV